MIDANEEERLSREYRKTGDIALRNKLVENYLYVAEILSKKFAGRGVPYDDLLQIASEALILGVEKFDPDMGTRFTTYITPTVTGMIKNYFRDFSRAVRPPRRVYALASKIRAETNEFFKEHGFKPTVKQLSEKLGASEELIMEALEYRAPVSLDAKVENEDGEGHLYDIIPDEQQLRKIRGLRIFKNRNSKTRPHRAEGGGVKIYSRQIAGGGGQNTRRKPDVRIPRGAENS